MKSIKKSAVAIAILMVLSKALGLIREVLLAKKFGTSYIVDVYSISISLPSVLFAVFASGISNSYIPTYVRVAENRKDRFFYNTINIVTVFSFASCLICLFFSKPIAGFLAPGFSGEALELLEHFISIVVFIFPFMAAFSILCAHGQVKEEFVFVNFCDFILVNVVIIISISLSSKSTSDILVFGYVISMVIATIVLGLQLFIGKKAIYRPYLNFRDRDFITLIKISLSLGVSLIVNQLNSVIDKMFASLAGVGVTSALEYSNKIQLIPYSLSASVILSVCFPRMNMFFAANDKEKAMYYVDKAVKIAVYVTIPVVFILTFFSRTVVSVLLERGSFDAESTVVTSTCLICYSLGLPFYALREISSKTLAANMQQKQILKNTIIAVICNISLNYILMNMFGYKGLALATSISGFISFVFMQFSLKRVELSIISKKQILNCLKLVFCACGGTICAKTCEFLIDGSLNPNVCGVICIIFLGLVYIALSIVFRIDVIQWVIVRVKLRKKKKE